MGKGAAEMLNTIIHPALFGRPTLVLVQYNTYM